MNIVLSPDGVYYLRKAIGKPVPSPYHRRWLMPYVLGPNPVAWFVCTHVSLALTPVAAWLYFGTMGLGGAQRIFAAALLTVLPGVWLAPYRYPVLTDAPAFLMSLTIAWLARSGYTSAAVVLSCTLACTRETGPVFAALWAWSPWPLVGLLAVRWWRPAAPPDSEWLAHPIASVWKMRRTIGPDASLYLRPWGAAILGIVSPSWQTLATVVVAHAQLIVAHDCIRLVAWCAPVMVASAVPHIPEAWWALALLVTGIHWDDRI